MLKRIAIYTNRLPYPPFGGIPRFIHGLAQSFLLFGIEVEFLLPNLSINNKEINLHDNCQNSIESNLSKRFFFLSETALKTSLRDVIISLQNWKNKGSYSQQQVHPLFNKKSDNILELIRSFDLLIIAGSPLLLFGKNPVIELISKTYIPAIFVQLFPLVEIEFYLGSLAGDLVAERISNLAHVCQFVVVPSTYVEQEFRCKCTIDRPIVHIPHGINLKNFNRTEPVYTQSKSVITASRFSDFAEHKNINSLLKAWSLVRDKVPEATLTLIGSGIRSTIKPSQNTFTPEGLIFAEEISDTEKIELLHKSRAFVLPSSIEAFGFSFVEALAAGVPVISLRSTAIPELVKDGENGILLEPQKTKRQVFNTEIVHYQPDISDLANAIIQILTNDCFYEKLQKNCSSSVKKLDWFNVAENYLSLCSKV